MLSPDFCDHERVGYEVYFLRRSIVEVTDLREGGDVRGSPLAVIMVLEMRSRTAHTMPSLLSKPVVCPVVEIHTSHEKCLRWSVGVRREH
jgi:hypothetical protein